jgi:NAD(P)-dependent dehydrogenase (short-subunit alcohol dehydrogenase family)
MDLGLAGKATIVSGRSDGLGYAIADRPLNEGALVTFFARREEKVSASRGQGTRWQVP